MTDKSLHEIHETIDTKNLPDGDGFLVFRPALLVSIGYIILVTGQQTWKLVPDLATNYYLCFCFLILYSGITKSFSKAGYCKEKGLSTD